MPSLDIPHSKMCLKWRHWTVRYTAALVATGIALGIWFLWPVMRQDPFAIFIAAVVVSARLLRLRTGVALHRRFRAGNRLLRV